MKYRRRSYTDARARDDPKEPRFNLSMTLAGTDRLHRFYLGGWLPEIHSYLSD